jgi:hypothetical protein
MFNNVALDVVIGLVFVYLLYSLLGTLIQEIIATNIGLRGKILEKAIKRMLDDSGKSQGSKLSAEFYKHPLIKYLADGSWPLKKKPSYIDPQTFSKVVIDLLRGQDVQPGSADRPLIQQSLTDKKILWDPTVSIEDETALYLKSIWADAQGDVIKFKASLENWFNEMMDRTTGWYKKYTQLILLFVGLAIAIVFNVDTIKIISKLQSNPTIRNQVLEQADAFAKANPNLDEKIVQTEAKINTKIWSKADSVNLSKKALTEDVASKKLRDTLFDQATKLVGNNIDNVNSLLAIGWKPGGFTNDDNFQAVSIIGWLLTALAISMGAPFWFDLLNKLMQLRGSIAPKDGSNKKSAGAKKVNTVG